MQNTTSDPHGENCGGFLMHRHKTNCRITIRFYRPKGLLGRLVCFLSRGDYGHCTVTVDDCTWNIDGLSRGSWYTVSCVLLTGTSFTTWADIDLLELDEELTPGTRFGYLTTLTAWATGFPRKPRNCVGSVLRVLELGGIHTKARTPHGLYTALSHLPGFIPEGAHLCPQAEAAGVHQPAHAPHG